MEKINKKELTEKTLTKTEETVDYSPVLKEMFSTNDTVLYHFFKYLSKDFDKVNWGLSKKTTEVVKDIPKYVEEDISYSYSSETKNIGLKDVEVADTRISNIDGYRGNLIYRGYNILDLTKNSTFEETAYLLLYDNLPTKQQLDEFNSKLIEARYIPKQMQKNMGNWRKDANSIVLLQTCISELGGYYDQEFSIKDNSYEKAISVIAKIPTIIASWHRIRNNVEIIDPDPSLGHAANFLYMMSGEKPDPKVERIFDLCLILYADYTLDISTFTTRIVASTRAHMYSAVSAAIGALSGELYGTENIEVMDMLLEIGNIRNVESFIKNKMKDRKKIAGIGNDDFKIFDPRAVVLKELSRILAEKTKESWFDITEKIETVAISEIKKQRNIDTIFNADLYNASVYYMLKIPADLYPLVFVMSRVTGWAAHIIEEKFAEAAPKPVMYNPKAVYVGKYCGPPGCEYITIDLRK